MDILSKNREDLFQFLEGMTEDEIRKMPEKGWSMMQALRHIQVSEAASVGYINKKKQAGESLRPSRFRPKAMLTIIDLAFRSGLKFKAPSVLSSPEDSCLDELKKDWNNTREELIRLIAEYPDEWESKAVYRHPVAGMLNITDAVRFFNVHQNQHSRQVRRIAKHLKP